jgi:HSP20 family molecular chaperone IbpA
MKTKRATEKKGTGTRQPVSIESGDAFGVFDELWQKTSRRAYEIFEARGRQQGYDLDDWLAAQSEVSSHVPVEILEDDTRLIVRAAVPGFGKDDLKVYVEPLRILIKGQAQEAEAHQETMNKEIWRSVALPVEIDPRVASAALENGLLEVMIAKIGRPEGSATEFHLQGLVENERSFQ